MALKAKRIHQQAQNVAAACIEARMSGRHIEADVMERIYWRLRAAGMKAEAAE